MPAAADLLRPPCPFLSVCCSYGLSWSAQREGYLLSGSDDAQICVWDVKGTTQSNRVCVVGSGWGGAGQGVQGCMGSYCRWLAKAATGAARVLPTLRPHLPSSIPSPLPQQLAALHIFQGHLGVVEDVAWHPRHADLFGSVGDDKKLVGA